MNKDNSINNKIRERIILQAQKAVLDIPSDIYTKIWDEVSESTDIVIIVSEIRGTLLF